MFCNYHAPGKVNYNLSESRFFAQNDDYFYISSGSGIVQISKHDGSELELIHNVWETELNYFNTPLFINGDRLYYLNGVEISGVSLDDYGTRFGLWSPFGCQNRSLFIQIRTIYRVEIPYRPPLHRTAYT